MRRCYERWKGGQPAVRAQPAGRARAGVPSRPCIYKGEARTPQGQHARRVARLGGGQRCPNHAQPAVRCGDDRRAERTGSSLAPLGLARLSARQSCGDILCS